MRHSYIKYFAALILVFFLGRAQTNAQISVTDSLDAEALAELLTGEGVIVLNPTVNATCPLWARGKFTYNGLASNIGIDSGLVLTCGRVETVGGQIGVNAPYGSFATTSFSGGFPYAPGDPQLTALAGITTNDACVLEFDFIPAGDSVKFEYVFASEEYNGPHGNFNCSINDVFGFFISGPGFTGSTNIALVPGTTNVAVGVSTVNDGVGGCSNYTQFYNSNAGSTTFVYSGFTDVFVAQAAVSPCDTFHLKLAIADASDAVYDSGVFLKAGSLSSTALYVKTFGGGGLETPFTNTVRGCPPGVVRVSRSGNLNQPVTIPLTIGGTAVNGVDYAPLPNNVTIPAGDSVATLYVDGIPVFPAAGPKSVIISILSPYTCNGDTIVLAADTIMIYDSIYVNILTADTAICRGQTVNILVEADSTLEYEWTPSGTVANPTVMNATVTPTDPTTYTISVRLPGSLGTGCAPSTDQIFIDTKDTPQVDLGPDKVTCGDAVQLYANTFPVNPDETFEWTPATALNNPAIRDPLSTPTGDIEYVVKVYPGAIGCDGYDTVKIRLLPDHITVLNNDTIVCAGTQIPLRADGDTAFSYNWTPEPDVANPFIPNTTLTAQTSGYYTLTASYPGCVDMPDSFYVEVQPVPDVNIGPDRTICTYDTLQMFASVMPASYPSYSYEWKPGVDLTDSMVQSPIFSGDATIQQMHVIVKTPLGCWGSDTMMIVVHPGDFMQVTPEDTAFCPPARMQLVASGANSYKWSPDYGLDNPDIANPFASPVSTTEYEVIGTKMYGSHACYDTLSVNFKVNANAVVHLPDSVQLWPGEKYQMDPGGNCMYFSWFPSSGLNADNISNPVAQPEVRTRYFVTATTELGCVIKDSIDVLVNTESILDAPNGFAPGSGEDFKIVKRGIATLKYFRIFNRWGNKVFETTDINQGWDGLFNGSPQPMGVYIYSIDAVTSTGKPFRKDGNMTLVR